MNLIYCASFLLIPFVMAFELKPLSHDGINTTELVFDGFMTLDIIFSFFTSYVTNDDEEITLKKTMWAYLTGYFLCDGLGVFPSLITLEQVEWVYFFKLFRYLQITRLFK